MVAIFCEVVELLENGVLRGWTEGSTRSRHSEFCLFGLYVSGAGGQGLCVLGKP